MKNKRFDLNKSLKSIILTQVIGLIALILLSNGFMTLWLKKLGINSSDILLFKSMPSLVGIVTVIPLALLADRFGKKLIGGLGNLMLILSFLCLALPGFFHLSNLRLWGLISYLLISLGIVMFASSWFGLIGPVIPSKLRGSFFATLRISWQAAAILVTLVVMSIVETNKSVQVFSMILLVATIALVIRFIPYLSIPEFKDKSRTEKKPFLKIIRKFLKNKKYRLFCFYSFTNGCLIGTLVTQFILLQTDIISFSDSTVLLTGNIMLFGSILGFYIGGKLTKRIGDLQVMIVGAISMMIIIQLPHLRHFTNINPVALIGTALFFVGLIISSMGIGSSSFILSIIPRDNRSLANALNASFSSLGVALAGLVTSKFVKHLDLFPLSSIPQVSIYDLFLIALTLVAFCLLPILIKIKKTPSTYHED